MARIQDLTVRAAMDTAGITRGVQRAVREMEALRQSARQSLGDMGGWREVDLSDDARRAATDAGQAFNDALAGSIEADRQRVSDAIEQSVGGAADAVQEAAAEAAASVQELGQAAEESAPQITGWDEWAAAVREAKESATQAQRELIDSTQEVTRETEMSAVEIDRLEEEYAARRRAREQSSTVDAAQAARDRAAASAAALERQFQLDQARIKDAQLRGFLTPAEAARAGREAAQAFNTGMIGVIDRADAQMAFRGQQGQESFTRLAGSIRNVDASSRASVAGVSRLNFTLASLLRQATGTHPAVAQLANVLGSFAIGSAVMVAVFAGLAALAVAWNRLTADAREAREELERVRDVLERVGERREIEALGPGGDILVEEKVVVAELTRLAEERQRIIQRFEGTNWGEAFAVAQQLMTDALAENDREQLELLRLWADGMAQVGRERVTDAERVAERLEREAQRLVQAQRQVGGILREGAVAAPFGLFDAGDLPEQLRDSFQNAEALRGRIVSLTTALDSLREAGGGEPAGARVLLNRLRAAVAEADADVQRRVESLAASFARIQNLQLTPEISVPSIRIPAVVDPFSLESLQQTFQRTSVAIGEQFVRGVIDADEFEKRGREAAQRFNDALLAQIDRLRASGRLSEALDLAVNLIVDVDVPEVDSTFNDTIEGVRNVTSGFRDMADALGDTSAELASALRGIDLFINGIAQIELGRSQVGALGDLSQVSGALSVVAGVFSVLKGFADAQAEQARVIREATQEVERFRLTLSGFRADAAENITRAQRAAQAVADDPTLVEVRTGRGGVVPAMFEDLDRFLRDFGLTASEFIEIASAHGIEILDENGRVIADNFATLAERLGLAEVALTGFVNTLSDIQQERSIRDRLQGVDRSGQQQAEAFVGDIATLAPELFNRFFAGIDLSDVEAVRAAALRMFDAFASGAEFFAGLMGDLTREDLLKWFGQLGDALGRMDEAVNDVAGSLRGVPQGFRIFNLELARFNAMQAARAEELLPPVPPPAPVSDPAGRRPVDDPTEGGRRPVYNIEDNRTYRFEIAQQPGESQESLARHIEQVVRKLEREDDLVFSGTPSRR